MTKVYNLLCLTGVYIFFHCHVWIWESDHKESWTLKNWCFRSVVLGKTLESPLTCKEMKSVSPKGSQSWIFIRRTDAEALILWPPDVKNRLIRKYPDAGKDCRQDEKGVTEGTMAGWHHWLNGHEFEQALGDGEGQGSRRAAVRGRTKSWPWLRDWTATPECSVVWICHSLVFRSALGEHWLYRFWAVTHKTAISSHQPIFVWTIPYFLLSKYHT